MAADGRTVRLGFLSVDGAPASLVVPGEFVGQLAMTLAQLGGMVLRRHYQDETLRLVFPVTGGTVEQASDAATLILTMSTGEGFAASYGLDAAKVAELARDLETAPERRLAVQLKN